MNDETNIEEVVKKAEDNARKIEELVKRAEANTRKSEENSNRISQNTGALEVLHTIKVGAIMFFIMWLITFIMFMLSVGYIIYIKDDTNTIITDTEQEVEQENNEGDNNFIGRDGDING